MESTKQIYKKILRNLVYEFENQKLNLDYKGIYKYLNIKNQKMLNLERELGKTELIPREFYLKVLEQALKEVRDTNLNQEYKEQAAIVLLLSQLGCRIGELKEIEIKKKDLITVKAVNEKCAILHFKTYKTVKSREFKWTQSFLTSEGEEAYDFLCEMAKNKGNNRYLFINRKGNNLYSEDKLRGLIFKFIVRNYKSLKGYIESSKGLTAMEMCSVNSKRTFYYLSNEYMNYVEDDIIYYPLPHQFRVNVVNELYKKGIHIDWIRQHMNHLSQEMTIHYLREIEEKEKAVVVIKEFIEETIKTVENFETSTLYKKVDRFMNENKYSVAIDFEALIDIVQKKKPIREKSLGYCIKSGFGRACPKNIKIDITERTSTHLPSCEFLNITYERFRSMRSVIEYNDKNGFILEKERETKRFILLIRNYLLPELQELRSEIESRGIKETKLSYPHLIEIIDNIEKINNEVTACV